MITRRSMLLGLTASLIAAPAVIRTPGLLMKIVAPKPAVLVIDYITPYGRSPIMMELLEDIEDIRAHIERTMFWDNADDSFRKLIAADWPSRTIKAPPGGFKIARI